MHDALQLFFRSFDLGFQDLQRRQLSLDGVTAVQATVPASATSAATELPR
jgi:hypothetical protein